MAVIIQIESTITKYLRVRTIVVTKTLRTTNENRYLAHYLLCGSRRCDHRNGRQAIHYLFCPAVSHGEYGGPQTEGKQSIEIVHAG